MRCRRRCVKQPCASSSVWRRPLLATAVAALVWLQFLVASEPQHPHIGLPNCPTTCGNVSVPYPFGIQPGCYLQGFNLTCNTSYTPPRLFLSHNHNITVAGISHDNSTMTIGNLEQEQEGHFSILLVPLLVGPAFLEELQVFKWKVVSSILQGPNQKRDGNATCPYDLGTTACHSSHSTCQTTTHPYFYFSYPNRSTSAGYICRCDRGYYGNPYLSDGCQDIDECTIVLPFPSCFGNCTNLPGTHLCQCPHGTIGNPYTPNGCVKMQDLRTHTGLIIGLGAGSGAMLLFLVICTTFAISKIKSRRKKRTREKLFKQNRGQLLQQFVCQRADIAERMIITLEEIEKAINNFDRARELGGGGHGTVYKGILSSLHVVAIKKSKIVAQKEIDEFINEVVILSQISHKNIVKHIGCCLEAQVHLLVYEFISNGTLYNHLHFHYHGEIRLRIAVETARALAYIHSLVSTPIIHRDVKSANILLDDSFNVKLSDFGASRYVPMDQTGLDTTVQGTFGYLDPMYHSTGHLTEKSDVYSFGVILIELLTRKKPVSYRSPHGHGLVYHFVTLLSEGNLTHILDPQVDKEGGGELVDITLLAKMCVKLASKDRPMMREVEMVLGSIHAAKEDAWSDITDESGDESYNLQVNDLSTEGANMEAAINDD
ncbi:hypothetical protein U9M48_005410 [Paspalum notatum var. saurae]|uniref:Protein kinase domain-containing protein n=1 Tax=Paspalum notatum var. saurae TaxID=547442 RepID=A0AAQ3PVJ4_PASNO